MQKSGTYKVQATGAPAGAKFVNEKGEAKTEFNVGEKVPHFSSETNTSWWI